MERLSMISSTRPALAISRERRTTRPTGAWPASIPVSGPGRRLSRGRSTAAKSPTRACSLPKSSPVCTESSPA